MPGKHIPPRGHPHTQSPAARCSCPRAPDLPAPHIYWEPGPTRTRLPCRTAAPTAGETANAAFFQGLC